MRNEQLSLNTGFVVFSLNFSMAAQRLIELYGRKKKGGEKIAPPFFRFDEM
jgi:hypothetical protein